MKKSIITMLCVTAILIASAFYESNFVNKKFEDFASAIETLYEKTDEHTATKDDVLAVQKSWLSKKKYLHIFIPHNEIKEIDLWLSETVVLVRDEKWTDALSKIEVLGELTEQIPKTFVISIENIL